MKGIRFYEELRNKNRKSEESRGTVVAVLVDTGHISGNQHGVWYEYDCISSLFDHPNSVVCGSGVSQDYLWQECRRISEQRAREIHPELFKRLDD